MKAVVRNDPVWVTASEGRKGLMDKDTTHPTRTLILISAALAVLTLLAFEPVRHNGFVDFDDYSYIVENPAIQNGLTPASIRWAFTAGYAANWHPLTWLSHMVDIEWFGLSPLGHHLHNVLLHTAAAVLLFWVLCRMTGAVWPSAFAALVFAIHPLRVESVGWAAERKDVLSAVFWMLTVAAYVSYSKKGGGLRYLAAIFCFALGLMAKPMLVTLPLVLLLLDFWPLERTKERPLSKLIIEKLPFFALALFSCVITWYVQQGGGAVSALESLPLSWRIANALTGYTAYLYKTVWPADLAVLYPYPLRLGPLWKPIASLCLLAACSGAALYNRKKHPYLVSGWFWYIITLVPVIGLVQVGFQTIADRYTYIPSIGLYILFAWGAERLCFAWPHRKIVLWTLGGLVAAALIFGTRQQVKYWKDSLTLFNRALAVTEDNYVIHCRLAQRLYEQNPDDPVAEDHIRKAVRIHPDFAEANNNMAAILMKSGQYKQAVEHLQRALRQEPEYAEAHLNMASILARDKQFDAAIKHVQKAQEAHTASSHFGAAALLESMGKYEEAIEVYERAAYLNPSDFTTLAHLGILKARMGQTDDAVDCFRRSLEHNPDYARIMRDDNSDANVSAELLSAMNNLAWILATSPEQRKADEAVLLAEKACQLTDFGRFNLLDTLAAAYAADGQFAEAAVTAQKAIDLASAAGQTDAANRIAQRLQRYRAGDPFDELQ